MDRDPAERRVPDPDEVVSASRELVRRSREHVEASRTVLARSLRCLDRARNLLQIVMLKRELRRRRRM